jgi:hypothetical protein
MLKLIQKKITLIIISLVGGLTIINAQKDFEDITFGKYRYIYSKLMSEDRLLFIHLPDDYNHSKDSYPIIFQLYAHFKHNYYLSAIQVTDIMGRIGLAPKAIVVGIKNQEFRYRDLLPEDHWGTKSEIANFLAFFETELIPFIEENYRVNKYRILSAPQAGAAFGVYALCKKPQLFNAFFLSSPFWIESSRNTLLSLFKNAIAHNNFSNKFIMMSYGKQESESEMKSINEFESLIRNIRNPSFRYYKNIINKDFGFSTPLDIEKGMKQLFKKYPFPENESPQSLMSITNYYDNLSSEMNLQIKIPELALAFEGDKFVYENKLNQALEIYAKMHELYPDGLMGYDRMGDILFRKKEYEKSLKYYQLFLKKQPKNPRILNKIKTIKEELKKI